MGWFSRKPTPQKQVEAAVTVATNLYLDTMQRAEDEHISLQFNLPDSRYRYLIFCLSATIAAVLAYDEKKEIQPDVLFKGCLHFATRAATENAQEYFSVPSRPQDATNSANAYFTEFAKQWCKWVDLENEGKYAEATELICSTIHTTESNVPVGEMDIQRLGKLGLQFACRMPTIRGAFIELIG
jgi:hypothetical protein